MKKSFFLLSRSLALLSLGVAICSAQQAIDPADVTGLTAALAAKQPLAANLTALAEKEPPQTSFVGGASIAQLPNLSAKIRSKMRTINTGGTLRFVLFGSSIGNGGGSDNPSVDAPGVYLVARLKAALDPLNLFTWVVDQRSVDGSVVSQMFGGEPWPAGYYLDHYIAENPQDVVCAILVWGMNDFGRTSFNQGQTFGNTNGFVDGFRTVVKRCKSYGWDVIVMTSPHPNNCATPVSYPSGQSSAWPAPTVPSPVGDNACYPTVSQDVVTTTFNGTTIYLNWRMQLCNFAMRQTAIDESVALVDVEPYDKAMRAKYGEAAGYPPGGTVHPNQFGYNQHYHLASYDFAVGLAKSMTTSTGHVVQTTQGGTGQSAFSVGDMLYASAADTLSPLTTTAAGRGMLNKNTTGTGNVVLSNSPSFSGTIMSEAGSDLVFMGAATGGTNGALLTLKKAPTGGASLVLTGAGEFNITNATSNCLVTSGRASQSAGQVGFAIVGGTSSTNWQIYMPVNSDVLNIFGNSGTRATIATNGDASFLSTTAAGAGTGALNTSGGISALKGGNFGAEVTATSSGAGTAAFIGTNTAANSTPKVASFLAPNQPTGSTSEGAFFTMGKAESTNNAATFQFNYAGAGSANNSIGIGLYGGSGIFVNGSKALTVVGTSTLTAGVKVGATGTLLDFVGGATATLDFGSISAGASTDLTITVTGAATGDKIAPGLPSAPEAGIFFSYFVSAPDTVTVRATNVTASPVDPASASYSVEVISN